jgi:cytochrome c peroxidase
MAAREPYFHNGSASTLGDVVEFYNEHFEIGLTMEEKLDLKAFLEQL